MGRFKSIVKFLRNLSSRMHSIQTTTRTKEDIVEGYSSNRIPTPSSSVYELEPYILSATDVYLPSHTRDALDASDSNRQSASIADLCSQLGNQLPVQLVKLVAKDVLKALINFHKTGESYQDISKRTILLSPTDLKALVSQLRGDTQSSLIPSQLSIRYPFYEQRCHYSLNGDLISTLYYMPSPDTNAPVFSLRLDEECSTRSQGLDSHHQGLQAPEYLLNAPLSPRADMWTLGCILFELLTGESLFDPVFQTDELDISEEESHLIQMIELLGDMPVALIRAGQSSGKWFTEDGSLRIETTYYPVSLASILERHIESNEVEGTTQFLETLLHLNPDDRAMPEDIIDHDWFNS